MSLETTLYADRTVSKDHPRIVFRGMLDRLDAQTALMQCGANEALSPDSFGRPADFFFHHARGSAG